MERTDHNLGKYFEIKSLLIIHNYFLFSYITFFNTIVLIILILII